MRPPALTNDEIPRTAGSGYVLAFLVLLASLLVVMFYWRGARDREMATAQDDFVAHTEEVGALLRQRLSYYELVARGGVSLFASVQRPTRQQWQDYVDGLDLQNRFPALVGLGYAAYLSSGQLTELQQSMRDGGQGLFEISPRGPRDHYGAILFLEPKTQENLDAIGFDMYSEPVRQAAMEAAMDSGQAQLSGVVHLVQDDGEPIPALLMFQPVYRAGFHGQSIAERHDAMQGWVYLPFRVNSFVERALRSMKGHPRFRLVDVTGGSAQVLYSDPAAASGRSPAFTNSILLEPYGRHWRLEFTSDPVEVIQDRIVGLRPTLRIGLIASVLLFLATLTLVRTQGRAEQLAARMSESYRRSEVRFRSAMQYSAIGKALLDHEGRIVDANPALGSILGCPRETLIGTSFDSHFVNAMEQKVSGRERDSEDGVMRMTRALFRGDGVRQVHLTFAPVPGDVGQDIARLVQVEDVTERVRAEAQILALNRTLEARVSMRTRELTQANQELETFAYSVSHDLRAPLRSIDGFSRLLAERYADVIDATGHDYISRVRNAAARMGELIESMLKMSRVGRGGMNPEPVDLDRMAYDIIAELRTGEPDRRVETVIHSPLQAIADPGLVRSLLQNLLGNAWKFSRDRAVARIELGRNEAGEFFVRDNGVGFAQEYADKLFRPFQRLHHQDEFGGHGIGLASVKRIVERHGGSLRAEGVPGESATFYFTLPEPAGERDYASLL